MAIFKVDSNSARDWTICPLGRKKDSIFNASIDTAIIGGYDANGGMHPAALKKHAYSLFKVYIDLIPNEGAVP